ncbi:MAG: formyltransferase [Betaproteobacteria bacterium RIFCSPLOWO2_12_FULL_64_23]|nr:MAG: formyltransferase [Betaproteobacteria bacterium RIFCSPLOWO2_12_FULL_64_23]
MTTAVVFAYHNVGVRCLSVLLDQDVRVSLVVTHRDQPGETIWFDSVEQLARARGLPVITPENANDPALVAQIRALAPDFLFSFYYRNMLGPELLALPRRGAYNLHGSLLPKYRGRVPVNWAVIMGERETGATLHQMVEKPDAGGIVGQEAVPIGPEDTAAEVFAKVTDTAALVLARALPGLIAGSARITPQDLSKGSYFGGRKPEDGRIDWAKSAQEVHDLVRGVAPPYPGAFTRIGAMTLRILRTRLEPNRHPRSGAPGLYFEAGSFFADCGDGKVLRLLEIEAQGGTLDPKAFAQEKITIA